MHSHLLHYVIKLNGPGPNTVLDYSHFYGSSPLTPLSCPRQPPPVHPPLVVVVLLSASILVNQAGAYNEHRLYADDPLLKLPAASWKIYRSCSDPDVWGRRYRTTTTTARAPRSRVIFPDNGGIQYCC